MRHFCPKILCPNCVRILHSQFGTVKRKLPSHHWEDLANKMRNIPPVTRGSTEHTCELCFLAREQGKNLTPSKFLGDKPKPKRVSDPIPTCKYCHLDLPRLGTHYCRKERRFKAIYDSTSPEGLFFGKPKKTENRFSQRTGLNNNPSLDLKKCFLCLSMIF